MKHTLSAIGFLVLYFQASLPSAYAQAFGEYGRTLEGATKRHGNSAFKNASGEQFRTERAKGESRVSATWVCNRFKTD